MCINVGSGFVCFCVIEYSRAAGQVMDFTPGLFKIYNIINDMAEVLNASQMQKLQEVFVNCLSENRAPDYLQIRNEEFLDMFLTVNI